MELIIYNSIYEKTYEGFVDFARFSPPNFSIAVDCATTFDSEIVDIFEHKPMPWISAVV